MNMTSPVESHLHLIEPIELETGSLLERIDIRGERDGLYEAMIPVDLICREDVPVDQAHVEELKSSMIRESARTETGQMSPILVAEIPGEDKFYIVDGFHRDGAMSQLGRTEVFATVRPNTTVDELLDLRLLTANTQKSVAFARVVEWIGDAWSKTPWADTITAAQAFGLNAQSMTGRRLGLTPEETAEVRAWVLDKSEKWRMTPASMRLSLVTAENTDPQLVKDARPRASSRGELAALTPQHLGVLSDVLPGRFDIQNLVAEIAMKRGLTVPYTRSVAHILGDAPDLQGAQEIADATDWANIEAKYGPTKTRELEKKRAAEAFDLEEEAEVAIQADSALSLRARKGYMMTQLELGVTSLQNLIHRGKYVVPNETERLRHQHLLIDATEDTDIVRFLERTNASALRKAFEARMQATMDAGLADKIHSETGRPLRDTRALTFLVSDRISTDILDGGLRFLQDTHPSLFDRLISNAIRDELGKNRDVHNISDKLTGRRQAEPVTVPVGEIGEIFTGMQSLDRKHLVVGSFLGLCHNVVAQVLHVDDDQAFKLSKSQFTRFGHLAAN